MAAVPRQPRRASARGRVRAESIVWTVMIRAMTRWSPPICAGQDEGRDRHRNGRVDERGVARHRVEPERLGAAKGDQGQHEQVGRRGRDHGQGRVAQLLEAQARANGQQAHGQGRLAHDGEQVWPPRRAA